MLFAVCISLALLALFIYAIIPKSSPKSICVMVHGDLGRSPRMQFHALSLANRYSCPIEFIGLRGATPHPAVLAHPNIRLHYFSPFVPPEFLSSIPHLKLRRVATLGFKVLHGVFDIVNLLFFTIEHPHCIVIQTPPAIPLIFVTCILSFLLRCGVVVDWHNFGYTLLEMTSGRDNPTLVSIARAIEHLSGKMASNNLCVTLAMKNWLIDHWGISAETFHDQPPDMFKTYDETPISTKHQLFSKLTGQHVLQGIYNEAILPITVKQQKFTYSPSPWVDLHENVNFANNTTTLLTLSPTDYNPHKPFICISSTSWTEDEDFSLLLNALVIVDDFLVQFNATRPSLPPQTLLCIITGKGDQRVYYQLIIDYLHGSSGSQLQKIAEQVFSIDNSDAFISSLFMIPLAQYKSPAKASQIMSILGFDNAEYDDFLRILSKIQQNTQLISLLQSNRVSGPSLLKFSRISTAWLEAADYPTLLACCDLGISLHSSSSGLDLPMKVVDMFGAGLPVVALDFPCLNELVKHGENGFIFPRNHLFLAKLIFGLIPRVQEALTQENKQNGRDADNIVTLSKLRENLEQTRSQRKWGLNWDKVVKPIIDKYVPLQYHRPE